MLKFRKQFLEKKIGAKMGESWETRGQHKMRYFYNPSRTNILPQNRHILPQNILPQNILPQSVFPR